MMLRTRAVRSICPICDYPWPYHSALCISLQKEMEKIPVCEHEPPVQGMCKPIPEGLSRNIVVLEGVDDE